MLKKKYGIIYMIRNKINNKIYFGQTTEKNGFDRRYKGNVEKNTHNEHLKRSIEKYGIENFEIDKEFDIAYSESELNKLEEMYVTLYNTTSKKYGYNKMYGGTNKRHTEETKRKIGEKSKISWQNEEYRKRFTGENHPLFGVTGKNHPNFGRRNTEETKKRMSDSAKKRFENELGTMLGKKHSEESLEKMRKWQQENSPMRGKTHSEETKKKISDKSKELWQNEERRNHMSNVMKDIASSQEWRDKISNSVKNSEKHRSAVNSEEFRNKQSDKMKSMWEDEEYRNQMSQKLSDAWTDDRKTRHIEYQKERSKDPNVIQAKRDVLNNIWNNEETRQKMIDGMKKEYFIINTETGEHKTFKGRKEVANHFGVSESVVQICLYKKVLFDDKYIVSNSDIYNEEDSYITYTEYRISKRKSSEDKDNSNKNKSNRMKKVYVIIDVVNGLEVEIKGKDAVAEHLNVTTGAISHRLKTGRLINDRYKVIRKEDYE